MEGRSFRYSIFLLDKPTLDFNSVCGLDRICWQLYNIPSSKIGPKPIQKPHIPIYLGGYSQGRFARIANYANGWICVVRNPLDQVKSYIDNIRNECHKAKRDPKDINIAAIL